MIVVDASVVTKWLLPEEHSDKALRLLEDTLSANERISVPALLWIELANMLCKRVRRQGLSLLRALALFDGLSVVPILGEYSPALSRQALILADRYQLSASYDAHYIALAEMLKADLWTDDQRLIRVLGGKLPFVKWIGEYIGNQ